MTSQTPEIQEIKITDLPDEQAIGRYIADPLRFYLKPSKKAGSQAVALCMKFVALQKWMGKDDQKNDIWTEMPQGASFVIWSDQNIIKADGTANEFGIAAIAEAIGWDGDLSVFDEEYDGDWAPEQCQIEVQMESWTDKNKNTHTTAKVKYINPIDFDGPKRKGLDKSGVKTLNDSIGASLRALAGGALAERSKRRDAEPLAPEGNQSQETASPAQGAPAMPSMPTPDDNLNF